MAKALCQTAGKSIYTNPDKQNAECSCCELTSEGLRKCIFWESFRGEARAAIQAAYTFHKKERRWPSFCK